MLFIKLTKAVSGLCMLICVLFSAGSAWSQPLPEEKMDRGVTALSLDGKQAYISWRLLISDEADAAFNVYRRQTGQKNDFVKMNTQPITATTDYVDEKVKPGLAYRYKIKKLVNGLETDTSGEAPVFMSEGNQPWYSIALKDNVMLRSVGIGDLDGDGAYDFVVQHPNLTTDPYHAAGYWKRSTDTYKLDAYSAKGKFMWRYDMGWAIEQGIWYAPYMIYDVDRDGKSEVYVKAGKGDPRETDGHVLEGPEYLARLDPMTGKITKEVNWLSREGYETYNFWSRNFLDVAYLDGKKPSIIMSRGTYTIIKTEALDKDLKRVWYWESSGEDKKYRGQGQHGIMTADIDGDGKDELLPGTFALDDNGKPMWHTGLGHNDVGYVADIDPTHPGLEIFYGIETQSPKNGACMVDAATGKILWGYEGKTFHVHNQGMVGDIDPDSPGLEMYAGEAKGGSEFFLYAADGKRLSDKKEVMNGELSPRPLWWDADESKEINIGRKIFKYKGDTLQKLEGKVLLVADIVGDWREEIITSLPGELRIYTTNIPAKTRSTCLMQDRQYRLSVADVTMGYYYPPQLSKASASK